MVAVVRVVRVRPIDSARGSRCVQQPTLRPLHMSGCCCCRRRRRQCRAVRCRCRQLLLLLLLLLLRHALRHELAAAAPPKLQLWIVVVMAAGLVALVLVLLLYVLKGHTGAAITAPTSHSGRGREEEGAATRGTRDSCDCTATAATAAMRSAAAASADLWRGGWRRGAAGGAACSELRGGVGWAPSAGRPGRVSREEGRRRADPSALYTQPWGTSASAGWLAAAAVDRTAAPTVAALAAAAVSS